ncbi:MAG: hypothetical protein IKN07_13345 [Lachnospiraceae bacterium]|nr:hypothetical protein [Lachnospiraceae bacterium]
MRFSDTLFAITEDLWKEALDKPFVKKMADGSLEKHLYANYMLQDYLYLQDYVEILREFCQWWKIRRYGNIWKKYFCKRRRRRNMFICRK